MANLLLKPGEKARNVWRVVWMEDLCAALHLPLDADGMEVAYGKFLAYCASLHCQIAVSPIHGDDTYDEHDVRNWRRRHDLDPDTNRPTSECAEPDQDWDALCPKIGDPKKPHLHFAMFLRGPLNRTNYTDMFGDLLPLRENAWEKIIHPTSALRYLVHLDEHETGKKQYSALDVHGFGGIDLSCLLKDDDMARFETLMFVLDYIEDNDIRHYLHLVRWAKSTGDYDTLSCVSGRHSFFCAIFRSKSDIAKEIAERKKRLNGEISPDNS